MKRPSVCKFVSHGNHGRPSHERQGYRKVWKIARPVSGRFRLLFRPPRGSVACCLFTCKVYFLTCSGRMPKRSHLIRMSPQERSNGFWNRSFGTNKSCGIVASRSLPPSMRVPKRSAASTRLGRPKVAIKPPVSSVNTTETEGRSKTASTTLRCPTPQLVSIVCWMLSYKTAVAVEKNARDYASVSRSPAKFKT